METVHQIYDRYREFFQIGLILFATFVALYWQKRVLAHLDAKHHLLLKRVLQASTLVIALLLLLNALGVDLDALLALGGLGGLAIGIAGKDIFANFFGGLMLYVTKPFTIGDWISSPERAIEGRVEEIGWYSTRLRGLNRQPLYVPNAVFSTIILTNSSRMTHKRIEETLRVPYTPQEKMREMVDALQKIVDSHPDLDPKMEHSVFVDKFIRDAFLIKLVVYTKELSQQRLGTIKQDLLLQAGDLLASYSKRMT